jgi:hypothetical protein
MAGALTISTLNNDTGVLATQNGMTGIAKAWLSYNGLTQTVLGSFNISSVTYNGEGDYTANFTTAMANANYAVSLTSITINAPSDCRGGSLIYGNGTGTGPTTKTTTALRFMTGYVHQTGGSQFNVNPANLVIFGA